MTYKFVDLTHELKEKIDKIIKKEIESVRLAPEIENQSNDILLTSDIEFFNQNIKLNYKKNLLK